MEGLKTGEAIVKVQDRWTAPFLVRFDLFPINKGLVADEEVSERMKGFASIAVENEDKEGRSKADRELSGPEIKEEKELALTEREKALLVDVAENPKTKLVDRYKRCGLNSYQGNRAKNGLAERGVVEVIDVPTKTGMVRHLVITEKGKEVLEEIGLLI